MLSVLLPFEMCLLFQHMVTVLTGGPLMFAQRTCLMPHVLVVQVFGDTQYLTSLLGSLPGVDPNDPALQDTLRGLAGDSGTTPKPNEKKDDKKDDQ